MVTAEQNLPVITVVTHFGRGKVTVVDDMELLDSVLHKFMTGKSHFAMVRSPQSVDGRDPVYNVVGLITLEDVLEVILNQKLEDEMDHERGVGPGGMRAPAYRGFSTISGLSECPNGMREQQARAMAAFLLTSVAPFKGHFGMAAVEHMVQVSPVVEFFAAASGAEAAAAAPRLPLRPDVVRPTATIVAREEPLDTCYVVLQGSVRLASGRDGIVSTVGPWDVLAANALVERAYRADFTATASSPVVLLLAISRARYEALLRGVAGGGGGGGGGVHLPSAAPLSPSEEGGGSSPRAAAPRAPLPELIPSRGTSSRLPASPPSGAARAPSGSLPPSLRALHGTEEGGKAGEFFVSVNSDSGAHSSAAGSGGVVGPPGAEHRPAGGALSVGFRSRLSDDDAPDTPSKVEWDS
jgi:hypothetical protein